MKTFTTLAAIALIGSTGYAQMSPLPPSSTTDGVSIQSIGLNAGATHWENPANLAAFRPAGTTDGTAPITNVAFNPIGLPFGTAMPAAIQMNLNSINTGGGVVRTIFLAESAMWLDSLGYTRSGNFMGPQSFTAFSMMETNPSTSTPVNRHFGDYFDVSLSAGSAANFDIWFNGEGGSMGSGLGGDYTIFHPSNSSPNIAPGNVFWAQQTITTNTWIASLGAYRDVTTYVVGLEDWRLDRGSDRDYSDAVIAFQFFSSDGTPFTPVPEPSTYGLIAGIALLGFIAIRRRGKRCRVPMRSLPSS